MQKLFPIFYPKVTTAFQTPSSQLSTMQPLHVLVFFTEKFTRKIYMLSLAVIATCHTCIYLVLLTTYSQPGEMLDLYPSIHSVLIIGQRTNYQLVTLFRIATSSHSTKRELCQPASQPSHVFCGVLGLDTK